MPAALMVTCAVAAAASGCGPECTSGSECAFGSVCVEGGCAVRGGGEFFRSRPATPGEPPFVFPATRPEGACEVVAPSPSLGVDPFYRKHCDVDGLPILGSGAVNDAAFWGAEAIVREMVAREDVFSTLVEAGARIAIVGVNENTTQMPEFRDLDRAWNERARGFGGTPDSPVTLCAEENLLCLADDPWFGQSVLVHELAHTVQLVAMPLVDPTFAGRLNDAFDDAMRSGVWRDTYAEMNAVEYFATATEAWFGTTRTADPADGVYGPIGDRAALAALDAAVFALVTEVFADADHRWVCPTPGDGL